jgi:hypothetical protein
MSLSKIGNISKGFNHQRTNPESSSGRESRRLGAQTLSNAGISIDVDPTDSPEQLGSNTLIFTKILDLDITIKEQLADLANDPSMELMENGADKYGTILLRGADKLTKNFEEIFSCIDHLPITESNDIVTSLRARVSEIASGLKSDVIKAGLDWQLLQSAYANDVATMSADYVRRVADTIYSFMDMSDTNIQSIQELIHDSHSFNELLHLTHSYVMNNDELRDALELWSDSNNEGHYIRGLGGRGEIAEDIYQKFLEAWRLGDDYAKEGWRHKAPIAVDIVLAGNILHIVVRDYGHSLNLIINTNSDQQDNILIQYHMSKVPNEAMVYQLPGISTVRRTYASGQWLASSKNLGGEIINFVKQVPTDIDSPIAQAILHPENK